VRLALSRAGCCRRVSGRTDRHDGYAENTNRSSALGIHITSTLLTRRGNMRISRRWTCARARTSASAASEASGARARRRTAPASAPRHESRALITLRALHTTIVVVSHQSRTVESIVARARRVVSRNLRNLTGQKNTSGHRIGPSKQHPSTIDIGPTYVSCTYAPSYGAPTMPWWS